MRKTKTTWNRIQKIINIINKCNRASRIAIWSKSFSELPVNWEVMRVCGGNLINKQKRRGI